MGLAQHEEQSGCLPRGLSPATPPCISFYTHGKGLMWRQFYLAQCLVQWGKGVDRANWYIMESHPLFRYPGDWRTANASGQRTDMKCFLPPIQNLGEENTDTFFHPVSKAGTRGVVPNSCTDVSAHLAAEARSLPCFQGCFYCEGSLVTVLSRKPIPALL